MAQTLLADLVAYSAQVACIVAVGSLLPLLLRIDAAGVRYTYWRTLLGMCLVLPFLQSRQNAAPALESIQTIAVARGVAEASTVEGASMAVAPLEWLPIVLWVVAIGIAFRLSRVALGLWRVRRLRDAGQLAPASDEHEDLKWRIGARAEIRYVPGGQPVTFGVRRPVVLLPKSLCSQSSDIQRAVLCHELFHVRRRDWMWVVAEEGVAAVLWFHPGVWWLVSRVRLAREEVVDELTVLATGQRRTYIEALLVFADAPSLASTAAFARRRHLFKRIVLISKEAVMSSRRVVMSCAAMAAVVVACGWYAVAAFPLAQVVSAQGRSGGPAVATGSEPGPLERRAEPITPENPIPRRTFSVAPQNPSDNTTRAVSVALRLVIDTQGRVAEVRNVGAGIAANGVVQGVSASGATVRMNVDGNRVGDVVIERGRLQGIEPPSASVVKAAVDAVRQWLYDPPAKGPIAFDVVFLFAPNAETQLVSHGSPTSGFRFSDAPWPPPPPPPPPPQGWAAGAVRVGGNIALPRKVRDVGPVYPPVAKDARVQGVVILEVLIGPDGRVSNARVLRSIPLLDQAALEAVGQWEFEPTRLNGSPVPVLMTATVQFMLPPQ